jgi:exosortase
MTYTVLLHFTPFCRGPPNVTSANFAPDSLHPETSHRAGRPAKIASSAEIAKWSVLPIVLIVAYGPMLWDVAVQCCGSWNYAHGLLVPIFAAGFLWLRRERIRDCTAEGSWWGIAFLVAAALLHIAGGRWDVPYFQRLSLLPCLAGIVLLVWGWPTFRWSGPSIVFLAFMYPFPLPLSFPLSEMLQRMGAAASAFILRVVGIPAFTEGTIIVLRDSQVEVAEACSGIRILAGCCIVALGLILLTNHKTWLKCLVVASAVPIAVGANIARITLTAVLQVWLGQELTRGVLHDVLGVCTPVVAVGLLFAEMALVRRFTRRAPINAETHP